MKFLKGVQQLTDFMTETLMTDMPYTLDSRLIFYQRAITTRER